MDTALTEEWTPERQTGFALVPDAIRVQRAARVCVAARILTRYADELATPIASRLLEEMGESPDKLAKVLEKRRTEIDDLDELIELRCAWL